MDLTGDESSNDDSPSKMKNIDAPEIERIKKKDEEDIEPLGLSPIEQSAFEKGVISLYSKALDGKEENDFKENNFAQLVKEEEENTEEFSDFTKRSVGLEGNQSGVNNRMEEMESSRTLDSERSEANLSQEPHESSINETGSVSGMESTVENSNPQQSSDSELASDTIQQRASIDPAELRSCLKRESVESRISRSVRFSDSRMERLIPPNPPPKLKKGKKKNFTRRKKRTSRDPEDYEDFGVFGMRSPEQARRSISFNPLVDYNRQSDGSERTTSAEGNQRRRGRRVQESRTNANRNATPSRAKRGRKQKNVQTSSSTQDGDSESSAPKRKRARKVPPSKVSKDLVVNSQGSGAKGKSLPVAPIPEATSSASSVRGKKRARQRNVQTNSPTRKEDSASKRKRTRKTADMNELEDTEGFRGFSSPSPQLIEATENARLLGYENPILMKDLNEVAVREQDASSLPKTRRLKPNTTEGRIETWMRVCKALAETGNKGVAAPSSVNNDEVHSQPLTSTATGSNSPQIPIVDTVASVNSAALTRDECKLVVSDPKKCGKRLSNSPENKID